MEDFRCQHFPIQWSFEAGTWNNKICGPDKLIIVCRLWIRCKHHKGIIIDWTRNTRRKIHIKPWFRLYEIILNIILNKFIFTMYEVSGFCRSYCTSAFCNSGPSPLRNSSTSCSVSFTSASLQTALTASKYRWQDFSNFGIASRRSDFCFIGNIFFKYNLILPENDMWVFRFCVEIDNHRNYNHDKILQKYSDVQLNNV